MYKAEKKGTMSTVWNLYKAEKKCLSDACLN